MPKVTIGIPTYNRADSVVERVKGLLQYAEQNDLNILVLDNASSDGTYEKLLQFRNRTRLTVAKHRVNLGYAGNFLKLFAYCKTPYLIVISDEDEFFLDNLTEYLKYLENFKPDFVSPKALIDGVTYRGSDRTSEIQIQDFRAASFYLSGLTFKVKSCQHAITFIMNNRRQNSAAEVYPQVVIALFLLASEGLCTWWQGQLVYKIQQLPSHIFDREGIRYDSIKARWWQYRGYTKCFQELMLRSHSNSKPKLNKALRRHRFTIIEAILRRLNIVRLIRNSIVKFC